MGLHDRIKGGNGSGPGEGNGESPPMQPNLPLVFRPGGHVAGNASPIEPSGNAVVVGVRSTMRY